MNILVWEDDFIWLEAFRRQIEKKNGIVREVETVKELFERIQNKGEQYGVLVMGMEILQSQNRQWESLLEKLCETWNKPVIVTGWKVSYEDRLLCYEKGVWNCIEKSMDLEFLADWVIARLKYMSVKQRKKIRQEERNAILQKGEVFLAGEKELIFTPLEYKIFEQLFEKKEQYVKRGEFQKQIWKEKSPNKSRGLDTAIKQIRRKLQGSPWQIRCKYGVGYGLFLVDS